MAVDVTQIAVENRATISEAKTDCEFIERTTHAKGRLKTAVNVTKSRIRNIERLESRKNTDAKTFDRRPFTIEFMIRYEIHIIIIMFRRFPKIVIPILHLRKGQTILKTNTPRRMKLVIAIRADAFLGCWFRLIAIICHGVGRKHRHCSHRSNEHKSQSFSHFYFPVLPRLKREIIPFVP